MPPISDSLDLTAVMTHEIEDEADDLGATVEGSRHDVAEGRNDEDRDGHQGAEKDILVLREPARVPGTDPQLGEDTDNHGRAGHPYVRLPDHIRRYRTELT